MAYFDFKSSGYLPYTNARFNFSYFCLSLVCSEHQLTAWLMLWVDSRSYCSCIVKTSNQQSCNFATRLLLTMPIKRIFSMREGIYRLRIMDRGARASLWCFFWGREGSYSVILRRKVNTCSHFKNLISVTGKYEIFKLGFKLTQLP